MKERCCNPSNKHYKDYGARGIAICDRWQTSFEAFLEDMGPKPTGKYTIERVDNSKGYSPENCIWATDKTQARNTRNNRCFTLNGETQCLSAWAEDYGIEYPILWSRIKRGWPIEKALTTPVRKR
jgi:hypothetical protein